jgi:hypothetical protein
MEEPRTRVVSEEPDCDVISSIADAHNIPNDGVIEVVRGVTGTADYMKVVSMQMNRVLFHSNSQNGETSNTIREYLQDHREHRQGW